MSIDNTYGLKSYLIEEEVNLPQNIRSTRTCKIEVVDWCDAIVKIANQIKRRAQQAPELDDDCHAEIMRHFRDLVNESLLAIYKAIAYNGEDVE